MLLLFVHFFILQLAAPAMGIYKLVMTTVAFAFSLLGKQSHF